MTLGEWHAILATEPATRNQVGAIHREFARLGFGDADRAERLAVSAELLGLDGLGSTRDLVMGQAGQLVDALRQIRDRSGLPAVTAIGDPAENYQAGRVVLGDVLRVLAAALAGIWEIPKVPT